MLEEEEAAGGGAGGESGCAGPEFADVLLVEAVYVFGDADGVDDFGFVYGFGEGELDEDAVDLGVGV